MPETTDKNTAAPKRSLADLTRAFNQAADPQSIIEAMTGLLTIAGLDQQEATEFVNSNISLPQELRAYGFSLNNPFIAFLARVKKEKPEIIKYLLDYDNWSCIHNALAREVISIEQLNFTSAEIDQLKPLVNEYYYTNIKKEDKVWLLQMWNWFNSEDVNETIRNTAFRFLFCSENDFKILSPTSSGVRVEDMVNVAKNANFSGLENVERLRRFFLYYRNAIPTLQKLTGAYNNNDTNIIINTVRKTWSDIDNIRMTSHPFLSTADISTLIHMVSDKADVASRNAISGKYQRAQGIESQSTDIWSSNNFKLNSMSKDDAVKILNAVGLDNNTLSKIKPNYVSRLSNKQLRSVGAAVTSYLTSLGDNDK